MKTIQDLLDVLNNPHEIPRPDLAELCFYLEKENGEEVCLKLINIGAFDISTDVTFTFKEENKPEIAKAVNMAETKAVLQGAKP
jgi:hypothetical protein